MSTARDRLVLAATLLCESAWLYAAFQLAGMAIGGAGTPLGWTAVLAILTCGFFLTRGLQMIALPDLTAYSIQALLGVLVLYLTLGTQLETGVSGLDLGWLAHLDAGGEQERNAVAAGLGGVLGVGLLWRAGRLASAELPMDQLEGSFRTGVLVLGAAAVVDTLHSADLNTLPMVFLFFGSGLAGLSMGRLLPSTQPAMAGRTWYRVIGGVVFVVLVAGLALTLVKDLLSLLTVPIVLAWKGLSAVIFYVVAMPLAYVLIWLVDAFAWLMSRVWPSERDQEEREQPDILENLRPVEEEVTGEQEWAGLLQALEWTLVAILVIVVLFFLARVFRRRIRWRRLLPGDEGVRESVAEDADPASDLARLLLSAIPERFRRSRSRRAFSLPDDEAGIVGVFRIYFSMLKLADERGFPRPPSATPGEYERTLETVFPAKLVHMVTAAFNRACYGHRPTPREQIEEMQQSLDRLAADRGHRRSAADSTTDA